MKVQTKGAMERKKMEILHPLTLTKFNMYGN